MESLLLKNGRIVDPVNNRDEQGDLLVREGKIAFLDPEARTTEVGLRVVDCSGKLILPGLIDMHVHLREPGAEYKETIATGTRAAAAGGFTAVACMPNTEPVNDCQSVTRFILEKAQHAPARVYPVAAISRQSRGETLTEFGDLKAAGAVALSDDGRPVVDSQLMRRALEYASNFDLPVISHAEELNLSRNGVMNEGALSTRLGLKGIPACAEAIMVYRDLALAAATGLPVHIAHVSTEESVQLIRRAKEKGWKVTAETAPHYFTLTEEAVDRYNTNAKMNPPLRRKEDVAAIRKGLEDGALDAIATDHAPHSILEKELEFDLAANGIIGLETAVPLALALVRDGIIDVRRMAALMAVNPARILRVQGGSLSEGSPADITVIDPEKEFLYTGDTIVSKSRNTPFLNGRLKGKTMLTVTAGVITYIEE